MQKMIISQMIISQMIEKLQEIQSKWGDIEVLCDTQDGAVYTPHDFNVDYWTNKKSNEKIPILTIS